MFSYVSITCIRFEGYDLSRLRSTPVSRCANERIGSLGISLQAYQTRLRLLLGLRFVESICKGDEPSPLPHVCLGSRFVFGEVVESEVISGYESVLLPFEATAHAELYVRSLQFGRPLLWSLRAFDGAWQVSIVCGGGNAVVVHPLASSVAEVVVYAVYLRQSDLNLWTAVQEQVQVFPQFLRIVCAHGDRKIVLIDAMTEVLGLGGLVVHRAPMLLDLTIGDVHVQPGLDGEMCRQAKIERSAQHAAEEEGVAI